MKGILHMVRTPDVVSILNAFLGFSSILMAFQAKFSISVALIFLAAAADGLDGFLARRGEKGPLGLNLDSLADAVSFGAAPAVLTWARFGEVFWPVGGLYLGCGLLRLARFNTMPKREEVQERVFEGMPIPAAGMIVVVSVLLDQTFLTLALMFVVSILMISSVPYPKCRDLKFVPFVLVVALAALVLGFQETGHMSVILVFLVLMAYLIYPPVVDLCRTKRK